MKDHKKNEWKVLGVDPAPRKDTVIYDGKTFFKKKATELKKNINDLLKDHPRTLIAWDAPLSFDPLKDFYDRIIDIVVQEWLTDEEFLCGKDEEGKPKRSPINAASFANLSHWAISCDTVGFPFSNKSGEPYSLHLATSKSDLKSDGPFIIEVHPAVALGVWWKDKKIQETFPVYKKNIKNCIIIKDQLMEVLGYPDEKKINDDYLDAFVAYKLGEMFLEGTACWLGDPKKGGYVMPCGNTYNKLKKLYDKK